MLYLSLQFFYAISSSKSSNVIVLLLAQIMVSVVINLGTTCCVFLVIKSVESGMLDFYCIFFAGDVLCFFGASDSDEYASAVSHNHY